MTKPGLEPSNLVSRVAALINSTQVFKSNQLKARSFYDPPPRVMETKTKINKWDLNKQELLHNKGSYKQGEKTMFRVGENYSK